jgi:hypothetical protein
MDLTQERVGGRPPFIDPPAIEREFASQSVQTDARASASCEAWDEERVAKEQELAKAQALLQDENRQLEAELGRVRAQLREARAAAESRDLERGDLYKTLLAKDENISALEGALKKYTSRREAGARRRDDSDRFEYVLACNGQTGSIPRRVLASDPDSLLYKMYSGEWDYACDAAGRALITCHPQRWAAVLEYLATGAAPAERNPLLLEQARHWNLMGLVGALEALTPGVIVTNDSDSKGFRARGTFVSVMERLGINARILRYAFAAPQDRWWAIEVASDGVFLAAMACPGETSWNLKKTKVSCTFTLLLRNEALRQTSDEIVLGAREDWSGADWGFLWPEWGYRFHQLVSEPLARAHDSLVVEVEARYVESD